MKLITDKTKLKQCTVWTLFDVLAITALHAALVGGHASYILAAYLTAWWASLSAAFFFPWHLSLDSRKTEAAR